jgi:hypothetical protein
MKVITIAPGGQAIVLGFIGGRTRAAVVGARCDVVRIPVLAVRPRHGWSDIRLARRKIRVPPEGYIELAAELISGPLNVWDLPDWTKLSA